MPEGGIIGVCMELVRRIGDLGHNSIAIVLVAGQAVQRIGDAQEEVRPVLPLAGGDLSEGIGLLDEEALAIEVGGGGFASGIHQGGGGHDGGGGRPGAGSLGDGPARRGFGQELEALRQGRPVRGDVVEGERAAVGLGLLADAAVHVVAVLEEGGPPGIGGEANRNIRDNRTTFPPCRWPCGLSVSCCRGAPPEAAASARTCNHSIHGGVPCACRKDRERLAMACHSCTTRCFILDASCSRDLDNAGKWDAT
jgi:hypothetical protein